jgi:hypothetical protein
MDAAFPLKFEERATAGALRPMFVGEAMTTRSHLSRHWLTTFSAATVFMVLAPQGGIALPGGGHPTNKSVTTYFSDTDSAGNPADMTSDGQGGYHDGVDGVTSFLTTNGYNGIVWGDWQFTTFNSTTRTVGHVFDTAEAVQPGDSHYQAPANPPFLGTQQLSSHAEVKCTLLNRSMLTMTAGSSFTCPLIDRFFTSTGVDYSLNPANSWSGYAETTDVLVTCNTADSVGCNDWFIDPIVTGQAVGRLTTPLKHGTGDEGDFYMAFHIHVTRP